MQSDSGRIIRKKAWPEFFEKVLENKKRFDYRLADFDVKEGDTLILEEWNPETREYTGRKIEKKISYVTKIDMEKFWNKDDIDKYGIVIMSLED